MWDIGDIVIAKNCQSYPNRHDSIFEDLISEKQFSRSFFSKENSKFFKKKENFSKKFLKKFYVWKKYFILHDF